MRLRDEALRVYGLGVLGVGLIGFRGFRGFMIGIRV